MHDAERYCNQHPCNSIATFKEDLINNVRTILDKSLSSLLKVVDRNASKKCAALQQQSSSGMYEQTSAVRLEFKDLKAENIRFQGPRCIGVDVLHSGYEHSLEPFDPSLIRDANNQLLRMVKEVNLCD